MRLKFFQGLAGIGRIRPDGLKGPWATAESTPPETPGIYFKFDLKQLGSLLLHWAESRFYLLQFEGYEA
jgi:hypothetical protein